MMERRRGNLISKQNFPKLKAFLEEKQQKEEAERKNYKFDLKKTKKYVKRRRKGGFKKSSFLPHTNTHTL